MARCPKLDYDRANTPELTDEKYICKVTGAKMVPSDPKLKYVCNAAHSDEYKRCKIFRFSK